MTLNYLQKIRYLFFHKEINIQLVNLIFLLFSFLLFGTLIGYYKIVQPDLKLHLKHSIDMMDGKLIAHPTFFLLVQIFSGFSRNETILLFTSTILLSLSQYFKCTLSIQLIKEIFSLPTSIVCVGGVLIAQVAIGNSLLLNHYIAGNISPNYFHNGTYLMSMPFVLLFIIENFRYYKDGKNEHSYLMLVYGLLIILTKPSFLFCWLPVMPFLWWLKFGSTKSLLRILQVAVLLAVGIIIQSQVLKSGSANFKVIFDPLMYFGSLKDHIKIFIASQFFFLAVVLLFRNRINDSPLTMATILLALQGFIISFSFYDVINGIISPNMTWQSSIIAYIELIVGLGIVIKYYEEMRIQAFICSLALLIQFICGIRYIQMSILNHSFYI